LQRRRPATATAALIVVVLSLVLAACASDDSSDSTSSADATADTEAPNGDEQAPSEEDTTAFAAAEGEVATGEPVPSAGCGTSTVRAEELTKQYLDDEDRWWLLTTPLDHDGETPLPMVVDFHGLAEGADVHAMMSNLTELAGEAGFVLVTPNGTGSPLRWNVGPDAAEGDNPFVAGMLDQLEAELCIDTSRVYATGLSNGAFMTSGVACAFADRFAAVAPVAGVVAEDGCDRDRPVPVQAFHGTADAILLFNGGVGDSLGEVLSGGEGADPSTLPPADLDGEGYPAAAAAWAEANGCGEPTDSDLTDTVIRRVWDCPAEGATEFLIVEGGGHSWPGSEFSAQLEKVMGPTDQSIDANELMWAFFQRFQLPAS
jgi:polyhydroxybutyrate depolymerase